MKFNNTPAIKEKNEPINVEMGIVNKPTNALKDAELVAVKLKEVLDQKPDPVMINDERYMEYEDWITLGNFYGLSVETFEIGEIERGKRKGVKAGAKVIHWATGQIVGGAEALAFKSEKGKSHFEYNQLASLAQTRAGSKALSNVLRWIVVLHKIAKGTPAEEMMGTPVADKMDKDGVEVKPTPKKSTPNKKASGSSQEKKDEPIDIKKETPEEMKKRAAAKAKEMEEQRKANKGKKKKKATKEKTKEEDPDDVVLDGDFKVKEDEKEETEKATEEEVDDVFLQKVAVTINSIDDEITKREMPFKPISRLKIADEWFKEDKLDEKMFKYIKKELGF